MEQADKNTSKVNKILNYTMYMYATLYVIGLAFELSVNIYV